MTFCSIVFKIWTNPTRYQTRGWKAPNYFGLFQMITHYRTKRSTWNSYIFWHMQALKPMTKQTNSMSEWKFSNKPSHKFPVTSFQTNPVTSFQTHGVRVPLNGYWVRHDCCPAMARTVLAFTHWPLFGDGRASPCTFFWTLKKTIALIPSAFNTIWTWVLSFFLSCSLVPSQHHCDLGPFFFLLLFPCWVFFLYLFIYLFASCKK